MVTYDIPTDDGGRLGRVEAAPGRKLHLNRHETALVQRDLSRGSKGQFLGEKIFRKGGRDVRLGRPWLGGSR